MTPWTVAHQARLWNSPGKNIGVCYHSFSRGSFLPRDQTQVSCWLKRKLCWFLSYIDMNQPWIYMYSPSQSPLPPPSPPNSSGSSQCTRPEHLSHGAKIFQDSKLVSQGCSGHCDSPSVKLCTVIISSEDLRWFGRRPNHPVTSQRNLAVQVSVFPPLTLA